MPNVLKISVRNVYGQSANYPANDVAQHFATIAGTRTLSAAVLAHAVALGFAIVVQGDVAAINKASDEIEAARFDRIAAMPGFDNGSQ